MESLDLEITPDNLDGLPGGPFTQPIIDQAVAAIRAYCGWHIAPQRTETILLDAGFADVLHLPSLHVADIAEIRSVNFGAQEHLVEGFMWFPDGRVHLRGPLGRYARVTFTSGHDVFPAELYGIVAYLAGIVKQGGRITSEALSGHSVSFEAGSASSVTDSILDKYKLPGGMAHA